MKIVIKKKNTKDYFASIPDKLGLYISEVHDATIGVTTIEESTRPT